MMDETQEGKLPQEVSLNSRPPEDPASPLKQIRTFQGDVASALQNQKESLYSIQQTEKLKRASGGYVPEEVADGGERQKSILFVAGGIVFIFLGLVGAWYGYQEFNKRNSPPTIIAPDNRFISVQDEVALNFSSTTKDTLISLIKEKSAAVGEGEILHLVMKKGSDAQAPLASTAEFFQKLNVRASGSLIRSFDSLFMIGSMGQSRFMIINLASFENAFPGMLSWEKDLPQDLGQLLANEERLKTIAPEPVFRDVIYKNKDVRVLNGVGTSTTPVLLYSFFDNRMLILTDDLEVLRALVDKLTQELLSR